MEIIDSNTQPSARIRIFANPHLQCPIESPLNCIECVCLFALLNCLHAGYSNECACMWLCSFAFFAFDFVIDHTIESNHMKRRESYQVATPELARPSLPRGIMTALKREVSLLRKHNYLSISLALPTDPKVPPAFAQLYVHDPALGDVNKTRISGGGFANVKEAEKTQIKSLLDELHKVLVEHNPYVRDIMTAAEIFRENGENLLNAKFAIDNKPGYVNETEIDSGIGWGGPQRPWDASIALR